jgi:multidrug resistance protein, MATE family
MAERERGPISELFFLAAPTVAQMASYTVMQFIDTWMLSRPQAGGGVAATAAANSGILAFAIISFGSGVLVLVNTLVSQAFGRKDFRECGRYLWQGIWIAIVYGGLMILLRNCGPAVFAAFKHPADLAAMEAIYWRIVLLAAGVKCISMSTGQFLLGVDRPRSVLTAALVGTGINAVAAWCVVLGHLGFSRNGVAGAAWAQNLGVSCEMLTLIFIAMRGDVRRQFGSLDWLPRPKYMMTLIRVGVPSGLQWLGDILAWGVFCNGVLGWLGPAAMQANTFMMRYMVVCFMPPIGIGTAVTALVGRYIGRQMPEKGARRAHLGFIVSEIYMLLCAAVFIFARGPLMRQFTDDPEVIRIGGQYLICAAVYEVFDSMYIIYVSALRGAGDTLVPAVVTGISCWTVSIGGGYAVARWVPALGFAGPWMVGCIYGAFIGIFMLARFSRGGWREIRLQPASNLPEVSARLESTS